MNTQSSTSKQYMANAMSRIINAPSIEKEHQLVFNDTNIIYKIYDRNKYMRAFFDTIKRTPSGTCVAESYVHYYHMMKKGYQPKIYKAQFWNAKLNIYIFHQFLVIKIDEKLYLECHSNGLHERMPFDYWFKSQNKIINMKEVIVNLKKVKKLN